PQHPTTGVRFDLLVANPTVQYVLVELLHSSLADVVRATVIDRVEPLELLFVDASDIADRMGEMLTLRIVAYQLRRHFDAGQSELIDRIPGDLLIGQLIHDGYRLEGSPPLQHAFFEQLAVFRGQLQHLDHGIQSLTPI